MGGRAEAAEDRGVSLYWLLTVPRPSQAAQLHEELLLGGAAGPRLPEAGPALASDVPAPA